jgi:hypothetical protein
MDVDAFLELVTPSEIRLSVPGDDAVQVRPPEKADALFHLPLLALAIMVIARHASFRTVALGRMVAVLLVEHFSALRTSPHGLETSVTLRRRCADALAFLEAAGLTVVTDDTLRYVSLTPSGKSHLELALRDTTDLGMFVRQMRRSHDRALMRFGDER